MNAEAVAFWVLSVVAVGAGIAMVTMRNVVHGALMLVLNFFAIAGLFLVLGSSFLAIIQIIIYAGAIMVLFLFVIMLLGVSRDDLLIARDRWQRVGAWVMALALVGAVAVTFVGPYTADASRCDAEAVQTAASADVPCTGLQEAIAAADDSSVLFAAQRLFGRYTFAFEFVSLLLIVAIVGAMVTGRRDDRPGRPGGLPDRHPASVGRGSGGTVQPGTAAPGSRDAGGA